MTCPDEDGGRVSGGGGRGGCYVLMKAHLGLFAVTSVTIAGPYQQSVDGI